MIHLFLPKNTGHFTKNGNKPCPQNSRFCNSENIEYNEDDFGKRYCLPAANKHLSETSLLVFLLLKTEDKDELYILR